MSNFLKSSATSKSDHDASPKLIVKHNLAKKNHNSASSSQTAARNKPKSVWSLIDEIKQSAAGKNSITLTPSSSPESGLSADKEMGFHSKEKTRNCDASDIPQTDSSNKDQLVQTFVKENHKSQRVKFNMDQLKRNIQKPQVRQTLIDVLKKISPQNNISTIHNGEKDLSTNTTPESCEVLKQSDSFAALEQSAPIFSCDRNILKGIESTNLRDSFIHHSEPNDIDQGEASSAFHNKNVPLSCDSNAFVHGTISAGLNRKECKEMFSDSEKVNRKEMCPYKTTATGCHFSSWPYTYPLCVESNPITSRPSLPTLFGQWMEAAGQMEYFSNAVLHGQPTTERAPTPLLLYELFKIFLFAEANVSSCAYSYLRLWLVHHPPVTSAMAKVYTEAFDLHYQSRSPLLPKIANVVEKLEGDKAALLLEYLVSLFEIDFNRCLMSQKKELVKRCLIIKWLWGDSYALVPNKNTSSLLDIFQTVVSASPLNFRLCTAVCALIGLVSECLRLASVQWIQNRPDFVTDSLLSMSYDMVGHMKTFLCDDVLLTVIAALKPDWLRIIIVSIILSSYSGFLLSETINVKNISLSKIVSQYFFLTSSLVTGTKSEQLSTDGFSEANMNDNGTERLHSPLQVKEKSASPTKLQLTAAKVNKRNDKGESAVHIACKKNDVAKLKELLAVPGVDVNMGDSYGWTPLHEACNHGSDECVEFLLQYVQVITANGGQGTELRRVNLNAASRNGVTPLIDAVLNDRLNVCRLLLKYGGKRLLEAKTEDGCTALDLAESSQMRDLLCSSTEDSDCLINSDSSQNSELLKLVSNSVIDTAPVSFLYENLESTNRVMQLSECTTFLSLLSILVSSYYSTLRSIRLSGHSDAVLHWEDPIVLANMSEHIKLLRRHIRLLTKPEDFEALESHLALIEIICLNGAATLASDIEIWAI